MIQRIRRLRKTPSQAAQIGDLPHWSIDRACGGIIADCDAINGFRARSIHAALRADAELCHTFFSRLQVIFYAAALLPLHLWKALTELSAEATGKAIPLVSAWGSTETAPLATDCHFQADGPGVIGLPVPGCELKLLPYGTKLEVRTLAIAALAPIAQDVVAAGHDRTAVSFLSFPNIPACRALCAGLDADAPVQQVIGHPAVRAHVVNGLLTLRSQGPASSTHAVGALVLSEPPSIDAGEITDKGYINQRTVLALRKPRTCASGVGIAHNPTCASQCEFLPLCRCVDQGRARIGPAHVLHHLLPSVGRLMGCPVLRGD